MKCVHVFLFVLLAVIAVSEAVSHRGLMKRKAKKNDKCSSHECPLELKPCPKDCPQSCGYIDSPDPCCPLLGRPTCPDY